MTTEYNPDRWVVVKIGGDDPHYRVRGGWSGGYLDGDSWRMNSGIVRADFDGDYWYFYGSSGSCYKCHVDSYGFNTVSAQTYESYSRVHRDKFEALEFEEWDVKDWDWIIG
jgi:hypothetical protein